MGLRKKLAREEPRIVDAAGSAARLPAQVDWAAAVDRERVSRTCPPLSRRSIGVSHADYSFVFRAADDPCWTCSATRRRSAPR